MTQIQAHLKEKKIIVKQQSGFRSHRQTKDNFFSICQRNIELFNKRKSNCVIFFDISKAFDKIWHEGLIYKLLHHKFDEYLIKWIYEFLYERTFCVKVNDSFSIEYVIETSVPQGGVLSPVLFSIYINDIILTNDNKKNPIHSTLFADDLSASCSAKKLLDIQKHLNDYLKQLEAWLRKWRLCMSPTKCKYVLFSKDPKSKSKFLNLKLFNTQIPKVEYIKFLGLSLDSHMSFNLMVEEVSDKCSKMLNILKIISHRSWKLEQNTLVNVYKSLIRSIMDYSAIIYPLLSNQNKKKINSIQYHGLRVCCRQPIKSSHSRILTMSGVQLYEDRANELNKQDLVSALLYENECVLDIINSYINWYPASRNPKYKTIMCHYRNMNINLVYFLM